MSPLACSHKLKGQGVYRNKLMSYGASAQVLIDQILCAKKLNGPRNLYR